MKYYKRQTRELAALCNSRGLDMSSIHRNDRCGFLNALRNADAHPAPFRFLELPPEIRNMVYRNLLIFKNRFACHPQILTTSKQVNSEAKTILYGDNYVDIKLWEDGWYIHGSLFTGDWPEYLRNVQLLRISYGTQLLEHAFAHGHERMHKNLRRVFMYRLCEFLMKGHKLRSIWMNFSRGYPRKFDTLFDWYALRMLGPLKECVLEGVKGTYSQPFERIGGMLAICDYLSYVVFCKKPWIQFIADCYRAERSDFMHPSHWESVVHFRFKITMLVIKAINHDPDGASVEQRNAIYATIVPWENNKETKALAKQDTEQVDFEAAMREFKMFSSFVQELREEVCRH